MTSKSSSKKITSRTSLTERVRQIISAAMLSGSLLIGGTANAEVAVPHPSSVVDRAVAVQDALRNKTKNAASPKLSRAQVLLTQWGNGWSNAWSNWDNWNNWRNWANWGNFNNWMNY